MMRERRDELLATQGIQVGHPRASERRLRRRPILTPSLLLATSTLRRYLGQVHHRPAIVAQPYAVPVFLVFAVGVFAAPHLPRKPGLAIESITTLVAGTYCLLEFWHRPEAHRIECGASWALLALLEFAELGVGRSLIVRSEGLVFLSVLVVARCLEGMWRANFVPTRSSQRSAWCTKGMILPDRPEAGSVVRVSAPSKPVDQSEGHYRNLLLLPTGRRGTEAAAERAVYLSEAASGTGAVGEARWSACGAGYYSVCAPGERTGTRSLWLDLPRSCRTDRAGSGLQLTRLLCSTRGNTSGSSAVGPLRSLAGPNAVFRCSSRWFTSCFQPGGVDGVPVDVASHCCGDHRRDDHRNRDSESALGQLQNQHQGGERRLH